MLSSLTWGQPAGKISSWEYALVYCGVHLFSVFVFMLVKSFGNVATVATCIVRCGGKGDEIWRNFLPVHPPRAVFAFSITRII